MLTPVFFFFFLCGFVHATIAQATGSSLLNATPAAGRRRPRCRHRRAKKIPGARCFQAGHDRIPSLPSIPPLPSKTPNNRPAIVGLAEVMECSPGLQHASQPLSRPEDWIYIIFALLHLLCFSAASISYRRLPALSICLAARRLLQYRWWRNTKWDLVLSVIPAQWRSSPAFSRRASILSASRATQIHQRPLSRLPPRFWILIQMRWPGLSLADVGAPSDTVLRVYSLMFFREVKQVATPTSPLSLLAGSFPSRPLIQ